MRDNNKEPKLTYALDSSDKMVHIGSVERGLSCHCRCPKCKEFLIAKLGHEGGRQAHFAHQKDSDCHGSYMSALHKLAEQIIEEEMAVMAPAYKEIDKQRLVFEKVEVEQRAERKDLQPDIVGVTSNGARWFIEIRNTHEVDETKKAKLIESNITCLEIDVREQSLENLKSFLLESTESREWINNPNYESQIAEAMSVKVSQVEKLLFDNQAFVIPAYGKFEIQKVHFDKLTVVHKSDDGLFVRVKAYSTEGIPYMFNIGSQESLNNMTPLFQKEPDCNELTINADSVHSDTAMHSCFLDTKWLYHSQSEKEHETIIREYQSNPQYELRPKADCYTKCKYHPFLGKCIYSKTIITQQGVDYVVCNKRKRQIDEAGVSSRNMRTTEEFLTQLQSKGFYETAKGLLAKIVKYDRIDDRILLLYRDLGEVRTVWPFHIAIIYVSNGALIRNQVAVFTNEKAAHDSYNKRLWGMRNHNYKMPSEENNDIDLPF